MQRKPARHRRPPSKSTSTPGTTAPDRTDPQPFLAWLFNDARTEQGGFPKWPYLEEYARELWSGKDLIVLKRRQILVSWLTGAYWHYVASRFPYHHGAVISAGLTASKKQGRRIVVVARRDGYDVHGVDLIKYDSGSEIGIFPSTEHAAVGESLKLGAHFDEYDFHPYAKANLGTVQPAVSNSGGQLVITSTANPQLGTFGPFPELWGGDGSAKRLFYGRNVRPDQGPAFFEAEAQREGMSDKVMGAFYPITEADAFIAREGLVFGDIDLERVFIESKTLWDECVFRVIGLDPGGGDPTALVRLGVDVKGHIHQYGEWARSGDVNLEHVAEYVTKYGPVNAVSVGETGGRMLVNTLHALGIKNAVKADLGDGSRIDGIETLRMLYQRGRLTISPGCTGSRHEFGGYRWAVKKDPLTGDSIGTKTPYDHHADRHDARRYAVMTILRALGSGNREVKVKYVA